MEDLWEKNVSNPNYSLLNAKNFFGGTDPIRVVIIIYIFLSLILNTINFVVFFITMKRAKRDIPLAIRILIAVLLVNFLHTFTYFFEWVIKEEVKTVKVEMDENREVDVGGLLAGNPNNMTSCLSQGFLLISSSISQDFLINIFFYMVSSGKNFENKTIIILTIALGFCFPFFFTLILALTGALGINDEFCYVNKFQFEIKNGQVNYTKYEPFQAVVIVVYLIRVINFIGTIIFLKKIINYIREQNESKMYLFKSIFIPIIQLFTIGIGVLYRVINLISPTASVNLAAPYLILNTSDGVLFPIAFFLQNNIFEYLKKLIAKPQTEEKENLIEIKDKPSNDESNDDCED